MISTKFKLYKTKTQLIITLLLVAFFSNACAQSKVDDNSTPEALAKTFLYAIQANDQELFQKHLASVEERFNRENFISDMWKSVYSEEEYKANLQEAYDNILASTLSDVRKNFSQEGLNNWSNVEFDSYSFQYGKGDRITLTGQVIFSNGDDAGEMKRVDFYQNENGEWRIFSKPYRESYYPNYFKQ